MSTRTTLSSRTTLSAARARVARHRAARATSGRSGRRRALRPALLLAAAACGALAVNVLSAGSPAAHADTAAGQPVSVADRLGLTGSSSVFLLPDLRSVEQLSAGRAQRGDATATASPAQASADQKTLTDQKTLQALAQAADAQAQELARQQAEAAAKAAAEAAAKAAAEEAARAAAATPASFQDYALQKLGGDQGQFSCLQNLWGKESGWNPNAQNPGSTAYGIPQFLDTTWAGTGIGKTSDGFRQIDAGLIYINSRYGTPCGAWAHSQANNWY